MDRAQSRRVKDKGYQCEVRGVRDLRPIFPDIHRVGSVGYPDRGGADLVAKRDDSEPVSIVYTWDSQKRLAMVTMRVSDLNRLVWPENPNYPSVRVQCKARNGTKIGSLLHALINSGKKK